MATSKDPRRPWRQDTSKSGDEASRNSRSRRHCPLKLQTPLEDGKILLLIYSWETRNGLPYQYSTSTFTIA